MRNAGHKPRRTLYALVLFALLLVLAGWFFRPVPPLYSITDLGTLPGESFSGASAINSRGDVVGDSQSGLSSPQPWSAFVYRNGAMTRLPQTSPKMTSASAINDTGQATGFVDISELSNQAAVFSAGRAHLLKTPPGYAGSFGTGISGRGQVVGALLVPGLETTGSSGRAFLYSGGRMTALALLPGWPASQANGINAAGQVVGDDLRGFSASQAFLYDSASGKMTALPAPPGTNSRAHAINAAGDVIGEIEKPYADGYVALWQNGRVKNLGALPGTDLSIGTALNDRGQATGNSFNGAETGLSRFLSYLRRLRTPAWVRPQQTAWVYRDGKMSDLNALIPRDSGWTLETATGINDRGQIVGSGLHDGRERAFLLTPQ